jgi:Phosphotransferase enzyme family
MDVRTAADEAVAEACAKVGLDGGGAQVIYARANIVYRLAALPVVARLRYAPDSPEWMARLTASVQVTTWLSSIGFPTVRPVDVRQPVASCGYLVTFWDYVPDAMGPQQTDIATLARLLRQLHQQQQPPAVDLPVTNPLGSLRDDLRRCAWLTGSRRDWLVSECDELGGRYAKTSWTLGCGLLHGDAYTDNLINSSGGGAVLADWDSVSHGPREQDLVPTRMRYRFGRPAAEWDQFCAAYGIDPDEMQGLPLLQRMRELRALAAYIRSGAPAAQAEVRRRIDDLMSGKQDRPWTTMNLASW